MERKPSGVTNIQIPQGNKNKIGITFCENLTDCLFYSLCRPLRIAFTKEDSNTVTTEYHRVLQEIDSLQPTRITTSENREITLLHYFLLTMVNGKVINALTGNPSTAVSFFHVIKFSFYSIGFNL